MGRLTKVFASGTIGNVIFYERLGTACARSKPVAVRQTAATKAAAGVFGKAKVISKQLREGLNGILPNTKAREVMYVTDNAVATWLRTADLSVNGVIAPPLGDLQLNKKTSFKERFKKQVDIDWSSADHVVIDIPSFNPVADITAPANTVNVTLQLSVTASSVNGEYVEGSNTSINIDYKQAVIPAQQVQLMFRASQGSIYLVVAALKYTVNRKGIKETVLEEKWLPVSVLGGYYKK